MAFTFSQEHIDCYQRNGYAIFRHILPTSLISDLRKTAEQARAVAHEVTGPQAQRLQPLSKHADKLNMQPLYDYRDLPPLVDAIAKLLGPAHRHGGAGGEPANFAILFEPAEKSYCTHWHRDWRDNIPGCPIEDWREQRENPLMFNQINCALYEDSCTWVVPGSHNRDDLLVEAQRFPTRPITWADIDKITDDAERERRSLEYCRSMPGAFRAYLDAGDFMIYRNTLWHIGNYVPYKRRATIHDTADTPEFFAWREWASKTAAENREAGRKHINPNEALLATV